MSPVPTVLGRPVWYEPLRSPSWLLPSVAASAPRVTFAPAAAAEGESVSERRLREGLPMFLAEAIRFSTEARAAAVFDPAARGDASVHATVALEGAGPERRLVVRVGADGQHRAHVMPQDLLESEVGFNASERLEHPSNRGGLRAEDHAVQHHDADQERQGEILRGVDMHVAVDADEDDCDAAAGEHGAANQQDRRETAAFAADNPVHPFQGRNAPR
jgi:hypothetical protein